MKKWLIITLGIIIVAAIVFFTAGSMTGNTVYETEIDTTTDGVAEPQICGGECDEGCSGNHEIEASCENLDCPKRETPICNKGF